MDCSSGYVSVHDGPNGDSELLGQYCGDRFHWSLTSSTNQLYLALTGITWVEDTHIIRAEYNTLGRSGCLVYIKLLLFGEPYKSSAVYSIPGTA